MVSQVLAVSSKYGSRGLLDGLPTSYESLCRIPGAQLLMADSKMQLADLNMLRDLLLQSNAALLAVGLLYFTRVP